LIIKLLPLLFLCHTRFLLLPLFLRSSFACEKVALGLIDDISKVVKQVIGEHWNPSFFIVKVAASVKVSATAIHTLSSPKRASRIK
jgi:hypothetical protein